MTPGFFRNPNELAIIDLTQPPSDTNPTLKTIRSFGSVPEGISLSPPMVVPGADDADPRTFAFILSSNNLTVLDTRHPDRREVSIRLDLGGQPVMPREVVFAPNTASAYVRSDNARDVLQVILEAVPPATPGGNDYRPRARRARRRRRPDRHRGLRRRVAAPLHPRGDAEHERGRRDRRRHRAVPLRAARRSDRSHPAVPDRRRHAAAPRRCSRSIGAKLKRVYVLDLEHINDPLTQTTLRTIALDQPVRDVVPVPGRELAMLVHDDARTVLGLLDMHDRVDVAAARRRQARLATTSRPTART